VGERAAQGKVCQRVMGLLWAEPVHSYWWVKVEEGMASRLPSGPVCRKLESASRWQ
jgi:hypothetical protein